MPSQKWPDLSAAPCVRRGPALPWRAAVQTVWVVGWVVVVVVALVVLAVRDVALRARVHRINSIRDAHVPRGRKRQ